VQGCAHERRLRTREKTPCALGAFGRVPAGVLSWCSRPVGRTRRRCRAAFAVSALEMYLGTVISRMPIFVLCVAVAPGALLGRNVLVLATAETHAMLDGCDCPESPGGGYPARATLVGELRTQGPVLFLDAGGFAAGGLYDTYSEGRFRDSLRTVAALAAMGRLGYDAVAVGDDDLQYGAAWLDSTARRGGVPLLCANCADSSGSALFAPFRVVERAGLRVAVTAVTTPERILDYDRSVVVTDPLASLSRIADTLRALSDVQIVLWHLGEEATATLAAELPWVALFVNGHRKRYPGVSQRIDSVEILGFAFQGKALAAVELDPSTQRTAAGTAHWVPVRPSAPPDTAMARTIRLDTDEPPRPPLDLYIRSQCPYGLDALGQMVTFARQSAGYPWSLWFVGTVREDGELESLRGPGEAADEKLWLAMQALYPQYWQEFLQLRSANRRLSTLEQARAEGVDTAALSAWVSAYGTERLAMHYRRSMRLGIDASPTLLRANVPLDIEISAERLAWVTCGSGALEGGICDSLPRCLDHTDCRRAGMLGFCQGAGSGRRCAFRRDAVFDFVVVSPDSSPGADEESAMRTTRELFPSARITRQAYDSRTGLRLVRKLDAAALPLYVFGRRVEAAANFGRISEGLERRGAHYTFRPGIMPATYFVKRPETPGSIAVLVDPLLPDLKEVLSVVDSTPGATVLPVLYVRPDLDSLDSEDSLRLDRARDWLSRDAVSADAAALEAHWALLRELDIRGPLTVLRDNRRLVAITDPVGLRTALQGE